MVVKVKRPTFVDIYPEGMGAYGHFNYEGRNHLKHILEIYDLNKP